MTSQDQALHIDVPVKLDEVRNVFSIASLSFEGDLPAALFHAGLIVNDIAAWQARSRIVVIFHTNAGHATLHDEAYDRERHISTGNPYRELIKDLMARGVEFELCGATAQAHGWVNSDTLHGIRVNTDAMARTTQLVQEGFVKISES